MHSSFSEYNTRMNIQRHINTLAIDQAARDAIFNESSTTKEILHLSIEELPVGLYEFLKQDGTSDSDPRTVLAWRVAETTYPNMRTQHIELEVLSVTRRDRNNRRCHILSDYVRYWFPRLLNIDLYDYFGGNPTNLLDQKGIVRELRSGPATPVEGNTEKTVTIILDVLMKRD